AQFSAWPSRTLFCPTFTATCSLATRSWPLAPASQLTWNFSSSLRGMAPSFPDRRRLVAHDFSAHGSSVWCTRPMAANPVFQQILRGPSSLELFEGPFQNQLSKIAELSFLPGSKLLKFSSQGLPDPQAELCFPFTHCLAISLRRKAHRNKVCVGGRRCVRWAF